MADFVDTFRSNAAGTLEALERPLTWPREFGEVVLWTLPTRPGQRERTRRLVCLTPAPFKVADLTRTGRVLVDLHPFVRDVLVGLHPLLSMEGGKDGPGPVFLVTQQAMLVVDPKKWQVVVSFSNPTALAGEVRDPHRLERQTQAVLARPADRDLVPWLYSALYNLGRPVGPSEEPALRLLVWLLIQYNWWLGRACAVHLAKTIDGVRKDQGLESLSALVEEMSTAWSGSFAGSLPFPENAGPVLSDWLGPRSAVLRRIFEDWGCLSPGRRSMESLARALSTRRQIAAYHEYYLKASLSPWKKGRVTEVVPFDEVGPLGLVFGLSEEIARVIAEERAAQRARRPLARPAQPLAFQYDLFSDLIVQLELDFEQPPPSAMETVLAGRLSVQTLSRSSRELAGLVLCGAVLEHALQGRVWPSPMRLIEGCLCDPYAAPGLFD